jgi:FAD/FMN-containing dehydrogenase
MANVEVQNWFGDVKTYPKVLVQAESVEELVAILTDSAKYPGPVRAIGSNHSTARCGVADGGTLVKMKMDRILSLSANTVTAEAGALYKDVAEELEKHRLQFFVNTEIGNLSIGSAACAGTKNGSMPDERGSYECGQVGSYVTGVKMVLPSGQLLAVDESQPDLLQSIRSSYGTFGIIYEATFRVRPIQPMAVHYETFTLEKFREKFHDLKNRHESMMLFLFPFANLITVEFRNYKQGVRGRPNRLVWKLRNYLWKTVGPLLCHEIDKHIPPPIRYRLIGIFNFLLRRILHFLRSDNTVAADQIIRYPEVSDASRYTFSFWAFPEETYPDVLAEYFRFSRKYFKDHAYRPNMPAVGYRIAKDQKSLLSYSFEGPVITIDPVSTGNQGWVDFLGDYNEFCSDREGVPLLNQTYGVTRHQAQKAFKARLTKFQQERKMHDPKNRLLNDYFEELLR